MERTLGDSTVQLQLVGKRGKKKEKEKKNKPLIN